MRTGKRLLVIFRACHRHSDVGKKAAGRAFCMCRVSIKGAEVVDIEASGKKGVGCVCYGASYPDVIL